MRCPGLVHVAAASKFVIDQAAEDGAACKVDGALSGVACSSAAAQPPSVRWLGLIALCQPIKCPTCSYIVVMPHHCISPKLDPLDQAMDRVHCCHPFPGHA